MMYYLRMIFRKLFNRTTLTILLLLLLSILILRSNRFHVDFFGVLFNI